MVVPRLPNEIILMIAEESHEQRKWQPNHKQLRALYATSRALRDFAGHHSVARQLEAFISPMRLKSIQLYGIGDHEKSNMELNFVSNTLINMANMEELNLQFCGFSGKLSLLLKFLRGLKGITLEECMHNYDIDKWKDVFDQVITLPLTYLNFGGMYLYGSSCIFQRIRRLLIENDKQALASLLEHFKSVKVSNQFTRSGTTSGWSAIVFMEKEMCKCGL